ncbi:hypothetical protein [Burkholderia ambifaria]|uniref:hypothetical protein n=1 Tax=Burkholderia ambifaria TaxID=152480 RepID=UPI00158A203D|nr:hypothetical protein [Burkholderia ambifaria]
MISLDDLHNDLSALETRLSTQTPIITGVQGVRIMRLIALMSPSGDFSQSIAIKSSRMRGGKVKSRAKMIFAFFAFFVCATALAVGARAVFMRYSTHRASITFADNHVATNSAVNFNDERINAKPMQNKSGSDGSGVKGRGDNLAANNSGEINQHDEKSDKYKIATAERPGAVRNFGQNGLNDGAKIQLKGPRSKKHYNKNYSRKKLNRGPRVSADPDAALIAILLDQGSLASKSKNSDKTSK